MDQMMRLVSVTSYIPIKKHNFQGINGFLAKDIVKEWRRGSRLLCIYCKGKYATLGCVGKQCK